VKQRLLAGDIGGTKTDLALFDLVDARSPELVCEATFASRDAAGLEPLVRDFLGESGDGIAAAAFGVAGPVIDGRIQTTNLPWRLEASALAAEIGCPLARLRLMNDLESTAFGALALPPDQIHTLWDGHARDGHRVVIAAGTGLGQAILFWDGHRFQPAATEGGHVGFAPRDEREIGLLRFLQRRYGHVSWERVVSGPGLLGIFEYLRLELGARVSAELDERMKLEDPSAVIGRAALEGNCATCEQAVELFVSLYGSQAGNLALTCMALGGVYVGGGIVTQLLPRFSTGTFMEAFRAKGRFTQLLDEVPVRIILDPKASLAGAAHVAAELARGNAL